MRCYGQLGFHTVCVCLAIITLLRCLNFVQVNTLLYSGEIFFLVSSGLESVFSWSYFRSSVLGLSVTKIKPHENLPLYGIVFSEYLCS